MFDVRHMHANLVRATGFEQATHMGVRAEAAQYAVVSDCFFAAVIAAGIQTDRLTLTVARMPPERRIDGAAADDNAGDDRFVFAMHIARLQLRDKMRLRTEIFRDNHQPGGVLVEAMYDTSARHRGQIGAMMEQRIQQCALGVTGCSSARKRNCVPGSNLSLPERCSPFAVSSPLFIHACKRARE
jgi:hypothetical protein